MKNPLLLLYEYDPSPPPIMDGVGSGSSPYNRNFPERLHPPPYPGSSVIPIYPVLSKNHNNYASMIVEASGGPPLEYDPDAMPSPAFPSITEGEMSTPSGLNVRAEEVGLVLLVLLLWVGAVALFFNRWGKIRMLEPYQPKFIDAPRGSLAIAATTGTPIVMSTAPHRLSYPVIEFAHQPRLNHHSRLNVSTSAACCGDCAATDQPAPGFASGRRRPSASPSSIFIQHHHPLRYQQGSMNRLSPGLPFYGGGIGDPYQRPRQNSVVVFATAHFMTAARRVKSAMDLQTLVLREETEESVHALSCNDGGTNGSTAGLSGSALHSDNHGTITCV